jgi:hypothetical protein
MFRDARHPVSQAAPPVPRFKGDFDAGILLTLGAQLTEYYRAEVTYTGPYTWGNSTLVGANLATFDSTMDSGEVLIRHRLLMPPTPYELSVLVGARFMDIDERLNYLGVDTLTSNDLIGLQAGILNQFLFYDRCWLDWEIKGSINNNRVTRAGIPATDVTSFLGETSLSLNYQLFPSTTLSMGYRGMWITGLALAEENVNNLQVVDDSGEMVYHGLNFGLTVSR